MKLVCAFRKLDGGVVKWHVKCERAGLTDARGREALKAMPRSLLLIGPGSQ